MQAVASLRYLRGHLQESLLATRRIQRVQQNKLEIAHNLLDILEDTTIAQKTGLDITELSALR